MAVGGRMAHVVDAPLRGAVLQVHGRDVSPRHPPAEPALGQAAELVGVLEDDHVDRCPCQLLEGAS